MKHPRKSLHCLLDIRYILFCGVLKLICHEFVFTTLGNLTKQCSFSLFFQIKWVEVRKWWLLTISMLHKINTTRNSIWNLLPLILKSDVSPCRLSYSSMYQCRKSSFKKQVIILLRIMRCSLWSGRDQIQNKPKGLWKILSQSVRSTS